MNKKGMLIFAGIALLAVVLLLKKPAVPYYPPVTGNQNRDNKVSDILALVAAAGATAQQIAKLIAQLSSSGDGSIDSYYSQQVSAGGGAPSHYPDGSVIDYSNMA